MRRKAEEEKKKVISRLLAAEGLELEKDDNEELQNVDSNVWCLLSDT